MSEPTQPWTQLRGIAAISEMLGMIGSDPEWTDHDVAAVLVDHEMAIRALLSFAFSKLAAGYDPAT